MQFLRGVSMIKRRVVFSAVVVFAMLSMAMLGPNIESVQKAPDVRIGSIRTSCADFAAHADAASQAAYQNTCRGR